MKTLFDEIVEKISALTPEEKDELLQYLVELDKQIEEKAEKSKVADKSK